ncbi:hypothetical protein HanRHA438_Chr08g0363971 [Helianthus annuus]|nr:hypothetical protein HanRHA438_Chr08g0363971 [Helianthus annuus]
MITCLLMYQIQPRLQWIRFQSKKCSVHICSPSCFNFLSIIRQMCRMRGEEYGSSCEEEKSKHSGDEDPVREEAA